jgi:sulfite reductase alpha subunit-like flavoprotein
VLISDSAGTLPQGELPANMRQSWRFLLRKSLPPQSLGGLSYAVFGLGDSGAMRGHSSSKPALSAVKLLVRGGQGWLGRALQAMCSTTWWPRSWTGAWQRSAQNP